MNDKKYVGLLMIVLGLGVIALFLYLSQGSKNIEKENEELKKQIQDVKSEELKKTSAKTNSAETVEQTNFEDVKQVSENFITLLYTSNVDTNDKDRYEAIKKVATLNIADEYFGEKRTSPIIYDTTVDDLEIYNDTETSGNNETKTFATLYQNVKDSNGKEISNRKVAMEITLIKESGTWKVNSFEQFDEAKIKNEEPVIE